MAIENYRVTLTYTEGYWRGHVEGPEGELPPYRTTGGRTFPEGYRTLTCCLDSLRTVILDDHAGVKRASARALEGQRGR